MGRIRQYSTISEDGRLYVRAYNENEPLKQAQKRYYEKNKEDRLQKNKEYYPTWLASKDVDDFKARQKEAHAKYYKKQKELKRLQKQESETTDEDKVAIYMELFNEIFKT